MYGSRDKKNRVNRRILKETARGRVVTKGSYTYKKTACRYEDIDYLFAYQGISDEEVKPHIMLLLVPADDSDIDVPMQP